MNFRTCIVVLLAEALWLATGAMAQSVCLPAPRLLTTMPMGAQVGGQVEVTITGDHIDGIEGLSFSHPGVTATSLLDDQGRPRPNQYLVSVAKDCPLGLHEARVMTRLGVSTSRVFSVGSQTEITRSKANNSLETATKLEVNSVCNAVMTKQKVDFYSFDGVQGQRLMVDCSAQGIESKLKPVLIIADETGADLVVERRGRSLDFTVPKTGKFVIKVHELTYNGGPYYFYRLSLRGAGKDEQLTPLPSTRNVSSFSWPPTGLATKAANSETEPNNRHTTAQKIKLPCDISGSFFPAADVDIFEFSATKGDSWWVEVASERLGLNTDPSIVVQLVHGTGPNEKLTDVVELNDIASPVKVSSNGYSYDGPPYHAGSTDILGKLEIKEDGVYRLQVRDLFGGTRNEPRNIYRLIVRKATPDFALVGWALHMNLRNGDRNALSKPIALRGGTTMPIEVVAVRRDGFDGEIEVSMDSLPDGVTARGLKIPAGQTRGILLITADSNAPRGLSSASFYGQATIDGKQVTRPCTLSSMKWPVPNAWGEIPSPRLLVDVPVSVCGSEFAPLTIEPVEQKIWEVVAGEKLTIPLVHTRRCDFSGANINLRTYGPGFEKVPAFDAPLDADKSSVTLDLATLKTPPGEYSIAFYGSAVAKYRYNPDAVTLAQAALKTAQTEATALVDEMNKLTAAAKTATAESKTEAEQAVKEIRLQKESAEAAVKVADQKLKAATSKAQPKDIVDIIVSRPISIRVKPAEKK